VTVSAKVPVVVPTGGIARGAASKTCHEAGREQNGKRAGLRESQRALHAGVCGTGGPSCRASGAVPNGTALFVAVTTLSTMGTCAPDVRFAVAGCTVQVLSDAASAQVSATAPAKESKKSATSW